MYASASRCLNCLYLPSFLVSYTSNGLFDEYRRKTYYRPILIKCLCSQIENCSIVGHNYIGSEHLLLGLLREGEGVAARVLESLGADPSNIRTQVYFDF